MKTVSVTFLAHVIQVILVLQALLVRRGLPALKEYKGLKDQWVLPALKE